MDRPSTNTLTVIVAYVLTVGVAIWIIGALAYENSTRIQKLESRLEAVEATDD